ncbi:hypothetical protein GIB67_032716 [Kingdonia uniflora]|uniref:Transcription factor MYC/MYB N-terminal domain-containing protein n=1 Tax=Kingdonia uniflora TaxID=39325 RepID=A0A7J7MVZ0_9MAGN|nr:hypothetical protein GIB67_032716 [Kingdonia uniflora]
MLTLEDAYYEDQFGTVLSKMLQRVHMLGEGIIGHVGFSGNHRWIFSDNYCEGWNPTGLVADQDLFQGNSDFLQQFLYGIKTIAVISVAPHGVVQFGSTEKILEKFEFVNHIRCLFRQLQSVDDSFPPKNFRTAMNNVIYNDYDPSGVIVSSVHAGSLCPNYGNSNNSLYDGVKNEMMQVTQSPMVLPQSSSFTSALQPCGVNPMVNNPPFYLNNQFQFPGIDPQVRLSAPSMQLPPVLSQCTNNLTAKNATMTSWNTEGSTLTSLEQQLLSGVGVQVPSNAFSANTNPLVTGANTFQNFLGDATLTSLFGVDGLLRFWT